jgi:protein gp37
MQRSGIEWTDATWNPVRGCTRVSEGCRHCYAERISARFSGPGLPYEGLAHTVEGEPRWTGEVRLIERHLGDPLRWKTPQRIFVNSMSDLFHEKLSDRDIDRVFGVMAMAPQHTFQVLTKRPQRMREYVGDGGLGPSYRVWLEACSPVAMKWPFPHVWLGTSVENQAVAQSRIPELLMTPSAVRFVSVEPLLGRVDLRPWLHGLQWVITGGESGPGARPMHPAWVREIRDACLQSGVPFFFKQWGEYQPVETQYGPGVEAGGFVRVGKGKAGRWLDGRTWDEFPRAAGVTLVETE